ncbi:hypothetical protein ACSBR2_029365 [Camellia fascicularis]
MRSVLLLALPLSTFGLSNSSGLWCQPAPGNVSNFASYINVAFHSSISNQAYLFMKNDYVKVDYAPGSKDDTVLNGPLLICDGFPSLSGTAFAEHEIDSAFGSHNEDEAFIFSGNLCAQINYAPGT